MVKAVRRSHIVGDVVAHYQRLVPGKQAVVFASDVETATDMTGSFHRSGVPAELVTAKTSDRDRDSVMYRFRTRALRVLVNVDLFGEGTDMPDLDVVIMARPTESLGLYAQQFNRASTVSVPGGLPEDEPTRHAAIAASDKPRAIIIDHVGNVLRFRGPPDAVHNQQWTLDARDRRSRGAADALPLTTCPECLSVYERFRVVCPECGFAPVPTERSGPEFVDGDLAELSPEVLAAMRGEVARVDAHVDAYRTELLRKGCPAIGINANLRRHIERQDAQSLLRLGMEVWAGEQVQSGLSDREVHRLFYLRFGMDVLTARALNPSEALALLDRITSRS